VRHLGPSAQAFRAAFGLGSDGRYIGSVDADGAFLAAIQALYGEALEKEARSAALEVELAGQRDRAAGLEARLEKLEARQAGGGGPDAASSRLAVAGLIGITMGWLWRAGSFSTRITQNDRITRMLR